MARAKKETYITNTKLVKKLNNIYWRYEDEGLDIHFWYNSDCENNNLYTLECTINIDGEIREDVMDESIFDVEGTFEQFEKNVQKTMEYLKSKADFDTEKYISLNTVL